MTRGEIVEKWAKCIMLKNKIDQNNEYKKLEIMICMMLCFQELLTGEKEGLFEDRT
jgi:hypothetical protein